MKKIGLTLTILVLIVLLFQSNISFGQKVEGVSRTPKEVYNSVSSNPNFKTSPNGEGFCWNASAEMREFLEYYKLSKNTVYLDEGIRYYDWLVSRMLTDPD